MVAGWVGFYLVFAVKASSSQLCALACHIPCLVSLLTEAGSRQNLITTGSHHLLHCLLSREEPNCSAHLHAEMPFEWLGC